MFNLKRKVKQVALNLKGSETVVKEIHDSFDGATSKLLEEANEILSKNYDLSKGDRLSKIGFTMSQKVSEAREINRKLAQSRQTAELIRHYETYYPNNKFITEELTKQICKKYGLVFGDTKYFIGDVPEKNLREIEEFKLRDDDMTKYECLYHIYDRNGYYMASSEKTADSYWGYIDRGRSYSFHSVPEGQKFHYEKPGFMICAPIKEFSKENMRVNDNYKLELHIPDPIVLQPVKGGYLIVTKWGLEGEDKDIVNEKMN